MNKNQIQAYHDSLRKLGPGMCLICNTDVKWIKTHVRQVHLGRKRAREGYCATCDRTYTDLKRHRLTKHVIKKPPPKKERSGKCKYCDLFFQDVKAHEYYHENKGRYMCLSCNTVYSCEKAAKRHMKDKHNKENTILDLDILIK